MSEPLRNVDLPAFREVHSQADIVDQANALRQWWLDVGARQLNGGDTGPVTHPCPVTITCQLTGEIAGVAFAPGSRARMNDTELAQALRDAAQQVRFEPPQMASDHTREERTREYDRTTKEVLQWLDGIGATRDNAPERRSANDSSDVEVTYRGDRLANVRVLRRDWALVADEAQIEAAVIQASRRALGKTAPIAARRGLDGSDEPGVVN